MPVLDWVGGQVFQFVHGNNLVYNTCWEDPRLDRVALQLRPDSNVLVITSAGCNALDYALTGPNHVYAVDMNPRQNALLELKKAAIRGLEYEDFFHLFGHGHHPRARHVYRTGLRRFLPEWALRWWDRWIRFFEDKAKPLFFRGTCGTLAQLIRVYVDRVIRVRRHIDDILDAGSVAEQKQIYDRHLRDRFWSKPMKFAMDRDTTLSLVGVPPAQRRQVELQYQGGIVQFVQDAVEAVFCHLPLSDNYFWRVYLKGAYSHECCPEFLKPANFERLKTGLVDRVTTHTQTVQQFLSRQQDTITHFVLLDHMDWLSDHLFPALEQEWQAISDCAQAGARILWRSGGLQTGFLDRVRIERGGRARLLPEVLTYHRKLAAELHAVDRVHTYGSFSIADLAAA